MADETPAEKREAQMLAALDALSAISATTDTRISGWVMDIRVAIRDRELHHFETEQENEKLKADLAKRGEYAILARGSGWERAYDLVRYDEDDDHSWSVVESDISRGAAIILRDRYNTMGESAEEE